MKTKLMLLLVVGIVMSCNDNQDDLEQQVLLNIELEEFALAPNSIFLSDKNGSTLSCNNTLRTTAEETNLVNDVEVIDDYRDISIVFGSGENIFIETYQDIKKEEWIFKDPFRNTGVSTPGTIEFERNNTIEDGSVAVVNICKEQQQLVDLKYLIDEVSVRENIDLGCGYVFVRVKHPSERHFQYRKFVNPADGDLLNIEDSNLEQTIIESLNSSTSDLVKVVQLTGLNSPGDFADAVMYYSSSTQIQNYLLDDGTTWYPAGLFAEYISEIEASKDDFEFFYRKLGAPVYDYSPIIPDINVELEDRTFRVVSTDTDVDFYSTTWVIDEPDGSLEWKVFQAKDDLTFHPLPEIPACARISTVTYDISKIKLKSIQSHKFENFNSLDEYLESRHGNATGGEGLNLIKAGGDYEIKSRIIE